MEVLRRYSNRPDLLGPLVNVAEKVNDHAVDDPDEPLAMIQSATSRSWRVADRLSSADIATLLETYRQGATIKEVARRYGLGLSTIKRLPDFYHCRRAGLSEMR